ncbi:MAG: bifunctional proline dehydrogenase/L-glutamate gamma-semialdehyde dehydrogenase [Dysgonamonadaceae bacterium]|jgi:RHH-type proline utilization regulon transcriptional repressor/proline dehydrogenase/delta 1-pyrroline-5-carboxylate dehydrogenase|nr:bifunctional proline dehydrogenase/L-glutamate gamma-semialdehyde dehydrogenase [Dysgonamonadaceae bacterium]
MKEVSVKEVHDWAGEFLSQSEKELTKDELKEQRKYAILVQKPNDKLLLSKMLDESSQIRNNKKLALRMKILIDRYGVPEFFNSTDAFLIKMFAIIGYRFPWIAMPIFKKRLRGDTNKVIINEAQPILKGHLESRKKEKIGQNVNLLGEVVLGDGEADKRYHHYLEALEDPNINYISIKISGIYAQIHPLNYEQSKIELSKRLIAIYQKAIDFPYIDEDGNSHPKFVNLDMEEYKDTDLTLELFIETLSLPQFKNYRAGIVVQAYLPDAWNFQTKLLEFAHKRVKDGGAPVKMRLVKGANLQMETVVSSLRGWENPVLPAKVEVDANYLHILDRALLSENAKVVHVGVASHNFFSIAYAHLLSEINGVTDCMTFEMLEGMANHLPRVMRKLNKQIILYTPVVKNEHFLNAVSYLVRRLDENTGKDNFLSYSFNLKPDSEHWNFLYDQFKQAYELKDKIQAVPFRKQDRNNPPEPEKEINVFHNEPDTNFDLIPNHRWAEDIRKKWMKKESDEPYFIPVQIGNETVVAEKRKKFYDRSQGNEICVCEAGLAGMEDVKKMMQNAEADASDWRKTTVDERNRILHQVAHNLSAQRGDLIGCMSAITGKTFMEGDVEVSEAIDFCRFYPITMKKFMELDTVEITPKGIVMVIPPWNFPLAIPVGGVAAALAGGNSVILKPATSAYPVARQFVQCFWDAGVPKDALQIVCCDGREPLGYLTSHPSVKHVILTGSTDTAFGLLKNNPKCPLAAETGGKNAIILTGSGDQDHAILNVVSSAFGNAGQKCSACSLLLVDKAIYNDPTFKSKLRDAVTSMQTGSAWEFNNIVGPMIENNNDKLIHAIENLEPGESWLVEPEFSDEKKYILKPTVKWGVKPGSYTFRTELFAPLLSVVCVDNLKEAIDMVNSSEYGLTSGLQTLDEAERALWKDKIEAGNLYINRGITGAIVNRQPFGGMKRSAFGGGIKAGGPNYVSCFVEIKEKELSENRVESGSPYLSFLDQKDKARFSVAVESYERNWKDEFSLEKEVNHLVGEENIFRYRPLKNCVLRIQENDELCDILMILAASGIAHTPIFISISGKNSKVELLKKIVSTTGKNKMIEQGEEQFLHEMGSYERVRTCSPALSDAFYKKAAALGIHVAYNAPLAEGRLELLHYLKEQSVSFEYHRYGSITEE